jgi:hypothetical protein
LARAYGRLIHDKDTKRIIKPLTTAFFILLISATGALAQVNQSNYRLQFAKGAQSAAQSRTIKKNDIHDIFFRARKGQRVSIKIVSTNGAAHFNFGAMHEFDVEPIQDNTTEYAGKLPFAGNGEYVIRIEADKATKYTLTVSIDFYKRMELVSGWPLH